MHYKSSRLTYTLLSIFIIASGLLARKFSAYLPSIINEYLGDALWASLIFFLFSLLFTFFHKKPRRIVIFFISLVFCYAIEISQLYHAEWIDSIRANALGGLVLGFGFLWTDIIAYTMGVTMAACFDILLLKLFSKKSC